ncbi:MAG: hypothetical protein JF616_05270 [Fibrobacteres bacterium]|jgi:uncharacterized repeat protein (TIGR04138 family)|nr:hypothetical protein [Fibrobacterota bacterium]
MGDERLREAHLAMFRDGAETFSPAGLEYIQRLLQRIAFQGKGYRDLRAMEACDAFRTATAADFGPFLAETLDGFGIRTGADLGRAIFLLAAQGCLTLREGESLEEYAACGDLGGRK